MADAVEQNALCGRPKRHKLMAELKAAVGEARAGTGDIAGAIQRAPFSLGAAAFTSLIQECAKNGEVDKALEVVHAMQWVAGIAPNNVHYSALIGALGKAGRWQHAEQLFVELQLRALQDPTCPLLQPNNVTYAALVAAYVKGGEMGRAMSLFKQQAQTGPPPDRIDFSCMVTACVRAGDVCGAQDVLDMMHAAGFAGGVRLYNSVIQAAVEGKNWSAASEVFLSMQCAGVDPCPKTCTAMMAALAQGRQADLALDLLHDCRAHGVLLDAEALSSALEVQVTAGDWRGVLSVLSHVKEVRALVGAPLAAAAVEACARAAAAEARAQAIGLLQQLAKAERNAQVC